MSTPTILYPGDPRVCVLLGNQKTPSADVRIRPCHFVIHHYIDCKYLLFHTLTRRAVLIEPTLITYFMAGKTFSAEILENETLQELYKQYFLVPEDCEESQLYKDIKEILRFKEEVPEGISNYVILPTTACNARCFYCFEQGIRPNTMTRETEEELLNFMIGHRPAKNFPIAIQWFGGEPLIGAGMIDRLSQGLKDAGIQFEASMISNGSLFTKELINRAYDLWNLKNVQITLDGLEEEYLRRKKYLASVKDPFQTVLSNIHALLQADIRVVMRLNLDANNIGELYECVNFISNEFSDPNERNLLFVYTHEIFGKSCGNCGETIESEIDLTVYVDQLNSYIQQKGLMNHFAKLFENNDYLESGGSKKDKDGQKMHPFTTNGGRLKSTYCMADRAEHSIVIDAEGRFFTCEAMVDEFCYGNLKDGITDAETFEKICSTVDLPELCQTCAYLPECTDFRHCPNQPKMPICKMSQQRRLGQALLNLYQFEQEASHD